MSNRRTIMATFHVPEDSPLTVAEMQEAMYGYLVRVGGTWVVVTETTEAEQAEKAKELARRQRRREEMAEAEHQRRLAEARGVCGIGDLEPND